MGWAPWHLADLASLADQALPAKTQGGKYQPRQVFSASEGSETSYRKYDHLQSVPPFIKRDGTGRREKSWYGWVRTSIEVGVVSQLGDWKLAGWARGLYRPHQRGHMWYLPIPRASRSCHYLFRPPVEGTTKLGLVPAAVVVASKIIPLTGPG